MFRSFFRLQVEERWTVKHLPTSIDPKPEQFTSGTSRALSFCSQATAWQKKKKDREGAKDSQEWAQEESHVDAWKHQSHESKVWKGFWNVWTIDIQVVVGSNQKEIQKDYQERHRQWPREPRPRAHKAMWWISRLILGWIWRLLKQTKN